MAANQNIVFEQFASYTLNLTITNPDNTPFDLTGFTGRFRVAERVSKTKRLDFQGTTEANKVEITNAIAGQLQVFIESVDLPVLSTDQDVTIDPQDYFYTLEITNAQNVTTRILDGLAAISLGIS